MSGADAKNAKPPEGQLFSPSAVNFPFMVEDTIVEVNMLRIWDFERKVAAGIYTSDGQKGTVDAKTASLQGARCLLISSGGETAFGLAAFSGKQVKKGGNVTVSELKTADIPANTNVSPLVSKILAVDMNVGQYHSCVLKQALFKCAEDNEEALRFLQNDNAEPHAIPEERKWRESFFSDSLGPLVPDDTSEYWMGSVSSSVSSSTVINEGPQADASSSSSSSDQSSESTRITNTSVPVDPSLTEDEVKVLEAQAQAKVREQAEKTTLQLREVTERANKLFSGGLFSFGFRQQGAIAFNRALRVAGLHPDQVVQALTQSTSQGTDSTSALNPATSAPSSVSSTSSSFTSPYTALSALFTFYPAIRPFKHILLSTQTKANATSSPSPSTTPSSTPGQTAEEHDAVDALVSIALAFDGPKLPKPHAEDTLIDQGGEGLRAKKDYPLPPVLSTTSPSSFLTDPIASAYARTWIQCFTDCIMPSMKVGSTRFSYLIARAICYGDQNWFVRSFFSSFARDSEDELTHGSPYYPLGYKPPSSSSPDTFPASLPPHLNPASPLPQLPSHLCNIEGEVFLPVPSPPLLHLITNNTQDVSAFYPPEHKLATEYRTTQTAPASPSSSPITSPTSSIATAISLSMPVLGQISNVLPLCYRSHVFPRVQPDIITFKHMSFLDALKETVRYPLV